MSTPPDLPQANLLSYEQQEPNREMLWVLRWVGIWIIATGVTPLLQFGILSAANVFAARRSSLGMGVSWYDLASTTLPIIRILIGLGIAKRMRLAFIAALILIWPDQFFTLAMFTFRIPWAQLAPMLIQNLASTAIQFAVLLSIYHRASSRSVLQPAAPGNDTIFLIQRVGWVFAWTGVVAILSLLAATILQQHQPARPSPWNPHTMVYYIGQTFIGLLGLALILRMRHALIALAILLPLQFIAIQLSLRLPSTMTMPIGLLISGSLTSLASSVLLLWLYRYSNTTLLRTSA